MAYDFARPMFDDLPLQGEGRLAQRAGRGSRHGRRVRKARHRPGAADGVGDGDTRRKTLQPEPLHDVAAKGRLAAEQMRATRDVQRQSGRRVEPDERRIAIAPVGDGREQDAVGIRIGVHDGEGRIHRLGVGQCHAGAQAEPRGRIVHGRDLQGALDLLGDHQRRLRQRRLR